jgi:hypothetical protein
MSNHNNETFVFNRNAKMFTIVLMVIGLICLGLSYNSGTEDMHHLRFWTNYLHNSVFFVGIGFTAVLFLACHALAWGGWVVVFKRVNEAMMHFLYAGVILFTILAIAIYLDADGTDMLYMWTNEDYLSIDHANFDELAFHKSAFLNPLNYFLTVLVVAVWSVFAYLFRKVSLAEDSTPYTVHSNSMEGGKEVINSVPQNVRKNRIYAAAFLPIAGFSSAFVIWQWVMSVDTHWYSTLFAWYCTVSMFVSMCSFIFLIVIYLRSQGLLQKFTDEHMHDLGKYIFGFSVFWAYLWFSQFMLIWYVNNGEETQYFFIRFEQFKSVFFLNLFINFVLPFFILMMNTSKRSLGTLGFTAGLLIFGHWLDFYQMIKPGVWYNYEHAMHLAHEGHELEDGHGDNTYHLNSNDLAKPVLTTYQEDDHGDHSQDGQEEGHDSGAHDSGHAKGHAAAGDAEHGHEAAGHHEHSQFVVGVHMPGFLEIGTFLGFLGLFLFITLFSISRAPLYPPNDPYILESEHYDTGIGPDRVGHH